MISGKRVLGLILARAGSKGLPGKNVRWLRGKPLLAWSISAGKTSRYVDDIVVSTDGEDIANIAREYGAEVPFMRPAALASDTSTSFGAIEHALTWLAKQGRTYDYLVLLEPTSPLRDHDDIDTVLEGLLASDAKAAVTICRSEVHHPAFTYRLSTDARISPYLGQQPDGLRRQDIEPLFFLDGTVYASEVATLRARQSFYHENTIGIEMPKWKSPEIDDEIDFLVVEAIMRHRGIGN